jgi:transposase-like protein
MDFIHTQDSKCKWVEEMNLAAIDTSAASKAAPKCPNCGETALNRYGRIKSGKQRYICLVCGRQFVVPRSHVSMSIDRPVCANCGQSMHIYARESYKVRFRCSRYPECKTYVTVLIEDQN